MSERTAAASIEPARGTMPGTAETTPTPRRARIGLLGAGGYTGQELARLAIGHPGLELAALCSRELAGRPGSDLLSGTDPRTVSLPAVVDPAGLESLLSDGVFDTLVSCLPHGAWRALVAERPALLERAALVIDLSSDSRDGAGGFVYGLPEAFRAEIRGASRVANPGCYPTAASLALLPALESGWIAGPVMVSALSGVSGAGRAPVLRHSFVELEGGAALYRVGTEHAHVPEMQRTFERLAGAPVPVGFAPQIVPMARGILLTATVPLARPRSPSEAWETYTERYRSEAFVRVLESGQWPETRLVRGSNRCDVAVTTVHSGDTLVATAAIDNLVKGAAGQAIQNLNLMLGWPEGQGLPRHGVPW